MVDDIGLDVYEYRLLGHITRVAGIDSTCWQSIATIAEACKFSKGKVTEARNSLEKLGLIHVVRQKNPRGGKSFIISKPTFNWEENRRRYAKEYKEPTPSQEGATPVEHQEQVHPAVIKKNPLKKNPLKKSSLKDLYDIYPSDIKEVVKVFSEVWGILPPERDDTDFSYWVKGGKSLLSAVGERDKEETLNGVFRKWKKGGERFDVLSPNSIVKVTRGYKSFNWDGEYDDGSANSDFVKEKLEEIIESKSR